MKEVIKMEKFKAFVMSTEFVSGLVVGFTLGALHHYLGLQEGLKMQEKAKQIVVDYFNGRVDKTDNKEITVEDVYVVWFAKTLQNWKALLSTNVSDGMYYEVTYNGDKKETYLDAYKKWENVCIKDQGVITIEKKRNSWLCIGFIVLFAYSVCSCSRGDAPGAGDGAASVGDKITAAGENNHQLQEGLDSASGTAAELSGSLSKAAGAAQRLQENLTTAERINSECQSIISNIRARSEAEGKTADQTT